MLVETLIALCVFGVILVALGICFFAINVPLHEEDNHVIGHNGQVAKRDPKYEGYYSYSWIFLRPYFMMLGKYFSKLNANGRNVTVTKVPLTTLFIMHSFWSVAKRSFYKEREYSCLDTTIWLKNFQIRLFCRTHQFFFKTFQFAFYIIQRNYF